MPDELGADAVALVRGENAERRKHVDVDEPPQRIEPARGEHHVPGDLAVDGGDERQRRQRCFRDPQPGNKTGDLPVIGERERVQRRDRLVIGFVFFADAYVHLVGTRSSRPAIRVGFFLPYSPNSSALVWLGKLGGVIRAHPNPSKFYFL